MSDQLPRATPLADGGAPIIVEGDPPSDLDHLPVTGPARVVDGVVMCEVTFAAIEPDPEVEVMVHINSLTDKHRANLEPALLRPWPGSHLRTLTYLLPSDGSYGYRLVRGRPIDRQAGASRPGWLQIHAAGEVDPRCPDVLPHPMGRASSVWTGPDAPRTQGWDEPSTWQERTLTWDDHDRRVWLAPGDDDRWLVLFDGAQWARMGLLPALRRALPSVPGVLLIDSVDMARRSLDLPDPERAARLLAAAQQMLRDEGHQVRADRCIVSGQSFGGLASASIVVDRPDLATTAIAQSASLWYRAGQDPNHFVDGDLIERVRALPAGQSGRLVVQAGTDERGMAERARHFAEAASRVGFEVDLEIWRGGHDYAWWRHGLVRALRASCGAGS